MKRFTAAWSSAIAGLACAMACSSYSTAHAADTYTKTKYPVVLVHGLLGFDAIGPINYFYGVSSALQKSGAVVFTPEVSQANSNELRGEQLLKQLQEFQAQYGYTKFNLVGHSHGGNTIRYVAGVAPDLVASVTTVGTPTLAARWPMVLQAF